MKLLIATNWLRAVHMAGFQNLIHTVALPVHLHASLPVHIRSLWAISLAVHSSRLLGAHVPVAHASCLLLVLHSVPVALSSAHAVHVDISDVMHAQNTCKCEEFFKARDELVCKISSLPF